MNLTNFRDLGGYTGAEGRKVRHGCFFRTGPVIFREDTDRADFEALGIRVILDLRSPQEAAQMPDTVPDGCRYLPASAIPEETAHGGNFDFASLMKGGGIDALLPYIEEMYALLPFGNPAYQTLFDLWRAGETPFVFHCTAGKDRTGFAAYLILKTLGVDNETVMRDYLLSNEYRKAENAALLARMGNPPGADELLTVQERYLRRSMDAIAEKYPDFERYVEAEYGVTAEDIHRLRKTYLE